MAAFDAPGVEQPAGERPVTRQAIVERGLAELDARGWDRAVIVGDEVGAYTAAHIAGRRPTAVRALVLGHAALTNRTAGEGAPLRGEVLDALRQVLRVDYRAFARALCIFKS